MNGQTKTLGEVRREMKQQKSGADVIPTRRFAELVKDGYFIEDDGFGLYHDGFRETNQCVPINARKIGNAAEKYPFVCWYNR